MFHVIFFTKNNLYMFISMVCLEQTYVTNNVTNNVITLDIENILVLNHKMLFINESFLQHYQQKLLIN